MPVSMDRPEENKVLVGLIQSRDRTGRKASGKCL